MRYTMMHGLELHTTITLDNISEHRGELLDAFAHVVEDHFFDQYAPSDSIGWKFHDEEEATALRTIVTLLLRIEDEVFGGEEAELAHHLWPQVVAAAHKALDLMRANDTHTIPGTSATYSDRPPARFLDMRADTEAGLEVLGTVSPENTGGRQGSVRNAIARVVEDNHYNESDPSESIGVKLHDEREATAMRTLVALVLRVSVDVETQDRVRDEHEYLTHPLWPEVAAAARATLRLMRMND
ncbi:hypothetical protein UO65_1355 [Actinokineospora spheciospongiae]|uniref:Uncharacterized protein n=2 Tax=Actinokineospora spheciospongiae TaxID=909613 RepID=W7J2R2_9PSEU|nr:hypothetical protein UO65_1355 [Actinokineospora spheciospongiae]